MENITITTGTTVTLNYRGVLEDGTEFDSSYVKGEPLTFTAGTGQMIPGFDSAVMGMAAGEKKVFTVDPEDSYGERNPDAVQQMPREAFGGGELVVGAIVQGQNANGQQMMATIAGISDDSVVVDLNHPLAGKELTFEIEVVSVT